VRAGGTVTLLARIFWQTGRFPGEVMSLPPVERETVLESAIWMLELEHQSTTKK
jgi:hypothetical protein